MIFISIWMLLYTETKTQFFLFDYSKLIFVVRFQTKFSDIVLPFSLILAEKSIQFHEMKRLYIVLVRFALLYVCICIVHGTKHSNSILQGDIIRKGK